MKKTLQVLGVTVVDASPAFPFPPLHEACTAPSDETGTQLLPSPANESDVRAFITEAIELHAKELRMPRPDTHLERTEGDTGITFIVRFGDDDFEVRVQRFQGSPDGTWAA